MCTAVRMIVAAMVVATAEIGEIEIDCIAGGPRKLLNDGIYFLFDSGDTDRRSGGRDSAQRRGRKQSSPQIGRAAKR